MIDIAEMNLELGESIEQFELSLFEDIDLLLGGFRLWTGIKSMTILI